MSKQQLWFFFTLLTKRRILIICLSLVILTGLNVISLGQFNTIDLLIYSFWGFNKQGTFIQFLGLLLINGLPLYLIGIVMSEDNFKNSMVVIRFKNKRQTFNNFQKSSFLYFGLYITLQLVIIFGIGYLGSLSYSESSLLLELQDMLSWQMGWEQINVNDFSPLRMGLILGFLRIIELMMMQIFFLNLKALTKNTLVSFLVVMSLYGLLFLVGGYIPIGISSFIRIILLSSNFYYASLKAGIILLVTYGISYLFIYVSGYKKLF